MAVRRNLPNMAVVREIGENKKINIRANSQEQGPVLKRGQGKISHA